MLLSFPLLVSLSFCKDWNPLTRILTALIAILVLLGIGASLGRSIWLEYCRNTSNFNVSYFPKKLIVANINSK